MEDRDRGDEERRRILRRATLYTYGFAAAAAGMALGGAALLAWMFGHMGLPFLETWLILTGIIVLPSLAALIWRAIRRGSPGRNGETRDMGL